MNLRELRQAAGKTREQVARAAKMQPSELSRAERRDDHLLSTLRRHVEAVGGELEVVASASDALGGRSSGRTASSCPWGWSRGYGETADAMETNVPGLNAAGDIRVKRFRQITTAVADGTIAALAAQKHLR